MIGHSVKNSRQVSTGQAYKRLADLIKGIDVAMLITSSEGHLKSRPLQTQQIDEEGSIWFFTSRACQKVQEIAANPSVGLTYSSKDRNLFIAIYGKATCLDNTEKIIELWSPVNEIFFPEGQHDPDLMLIRVDVERAEYWDGPGSLLGKAISFGDGRAAQVTNAATGHGILAETYMA